MKAGNESPSQSIVSVNTENLSPIDNLKLRMIKIKSDIPEVYMPVYEDHYGKQTDEMKIRVRECVNLRITDEDITVNWEKIVKKRRAREGMMNANAALIKEINDRSKAFKRNSLKKQ